MIFRYFNNIEISSPGSHSRVSPNCNYPTDHNLNYADFIVKVTQEVRQVIQTNVYLYIDACLHILRRHIYTWMHVKHIIQVICGQ